VLACLGGGLQHIPLCRQTDSYVCSAKSAAPQPWRSSPVHRHGRPADPVDSFPRQKLLFCHPQVANHGLNRGPGRFDGLITNIFQCPPGVITGRRKLHSKSKARGKLFHSIFARFGAIAYHAEKNTGKFLLAYPVTRCWLGTRFLGPGASFQFPWAGKKDPATALWGRQPFFPTGPKAVLPECQRIEKSPPSAVGGDMRGKSRPLPSPKGSDGHGALTFARGKGMMLPVCGKKSPNPRQLSRAARSWL